MAAPIIFISLDSSEESVGSHDPRVIIFGIIPAIIPVIPDIPVVPAEVPIAPAYPIVAPKVGVVSVISPIGVLDLVDYSSSSDYDPSEDSLPVAPELPLVSPFFCTDDSEANSKSELAEQRPERHESLTPSSEFPLALVVASPGIRRWPAILVRLGEAIPFGRPYHTYLNGSRKLLTTRKRVGPFPASRLAWRQVSHYTSSVHSSGQSHLGSLTRVASPRLVDSPVRTTRWSEAYMRWRSALLSTLYPPTTSESSLGLSSERSLDSSSPSIGPSCKRCKSPATMVPSSTPVSRSIAPALADLPPRKSIGVGAHTEDGIDLDVEVAISDIREDEEEFETEASAGGTMEIVVDPLATRDISEPTGGDIPDLEVKTAQRQLEVGQLVASGERTGLADMVRSLGWENLRVRRDRDDTRRRLRRLELLVERRLGFRR
ncbi:hypothetical protein Tco_0531334 [Tanacetum coccineum]